MEVTLEEIRKSILDLYKSVTNLTETVNQLAVRSRDNFEKQNAINIVVLKRITDLEILIKSLKNTKN